jgi:hypothetical protein
MQWPNASSCLKAGTRATMQIVVTTAGFFTRATMAGG